LKGGSLTKSAGDVKGLNISYDFYINKHFDCNLGFFYIHKGKQADKVFEFTFSKNKQSIIFTKNLLLSHKMPANFMNYLRFLAAFFILSVCFSCKTKEVVKPNSPPNAFIVTATLADNGKDLQLRWTRSLDIDGDAVTYAVVYKDTLAKNLSDTTYIIKDLPYETEIKGSVVAKDLKGGVIVSQFSSKTGTQYIKIPDINFEAKLIKELIDDVKDGKLSVSKAEKITSLNIRSSNITNISGIEAFSNLTTLNCSANKLTSIDLSNNIFLSTLDCSSNQLKSIEVSKNVNLGSLNCYNNRITELDLSKNTFLKSLDCGSNQLTTIDVSNNIKLTIFSCLENQLKNIDISKNTFLLGFYCRYNQLTNLDISKNWFLSYIDCEGNQLTTLDISKNLRLDNIWCSYNKIISLDVSKHFSLEFLTCDNNQISSLDLSKNLLLRQLTCYKNKIQTICVNSLSQSNSNWIKDPTATYKVCN
jgi:hypothetical protein